MNKVIVLNSHLKKFREKSEVTKQRMIKENKYTGGFRPKFGYDVDDNGYLVPCEKEQSIKRFLKLLLNLLIRNLLNLGFLIS